MPGFDYGAFSQELQAYLVGKGYAQFRQAEIDLTAVARDVELPYTGNGLIILPRFYSRDRDAVLASDVATRAFIKFNALNNPYLPFSLIANSGDLSGFQATIARAWYSVPVAGTGKLYLLFVTGVGMQSSTGGPSVAGYSQPQGGLGGF